ncbi:MAG: cobyrinate a,c-diamide synthase [Clostridia bacterium]|nr:cobyrinate a,c-diamide synthase [Clostridia bacterium]
MLKLMLTAISSNSGKTAVTCGLLSLLKRKGWDPCAFKCGPDYIDPMFHRSVLGISSNNLDVFLAGEDGVREVFTRHSKGHGAAVMEGVMGFYDGVRRFGIEEASEFASAHHVADLLDVPAVLVLRPKGAALTMAAVIKGAAEFRAPKRICGVIFNDCSEAYYNMYGQLIKQESGVPVLGYVPHMEEADFDSRHLGLMTAGEIEDLAERIDRIGQKMEETIDLERLFEAAGADAKADIPDERPCDEAAAKGSGVRIAVAKDEAFNFIYAETLTALEEAGAEIAFFSPVHDTALPDDIDGLYLPGGYPELYGRQLSENKSMLASVREAVRGGLPTVAECGGFLYLSASLEDSEGKDWTMVGVLPGEGSNAGKLVRFGYGYISGKHDSLLLRAGEQVPVHEFHYWDTTADGSDMTLTKVSNGKQWTFGYASDTLYAGFPHLYLGGGGLAERFVSACRK